MKGEIIAIGDELTSGRTLNTTSGFAARHLFDAGYEIYAMHTIGDHPELIGEALIRALSRVDFVLVTGGLGTTDDDRTNVAVSQALNRPTLPNLEILAQIRSHLDKHTDNLISPLEKLAWLPRGAEALSPRKKMSGYQLVHNSKPIFFLPGIPSQMQYLLLHHVLPRLSAWYTDPTRKVRQKMLRIFHMEEFFVNSKIAELNLDKSITIGYYPAYPELHITLTARSHSSDKAALLIEEAASNIKKCLGEVVYGDDQNTIEAVVGNLLAQKKLTLSLAESCTGGLIASRITKVPGSSTYFFGGVVSYANLAKEIFLDINHEILLKKGAVSKETAEAMAQNIRLKAGTDLALSVTGIAGPEGGSKDKPVGTVYMSLAAGETMRTKRHQFSGEREQIQEFTATTALDTIRRHLQDFT